MAHPTSTVCVLTGCGSKTVGDLAHLTLDPLVKAQPAPSPPLQPRHWDFVLGRSLTADVTIRDVQISRQHARIQVRIESAGGPARWFVQDHRSINGVFVNGRPIPPTAFVPLQDGDRLSLEPKHAYQWRIHLQPARAGPAAKRARWDGRGLTRPAPVSWMGPDPPSPARGPEIRMPGQIFRSQYLEQVLI